MNTIIHLSFYNLTKNVLMVSLFPHKCCKNWFQHWYVFEHHIRVISEGSYDTEDWSNDAEHSALIT